ncbi:hypothetical protein MMC18_002170 [Xylographa bjoerkii]|nr:hypothetical protein [Xylographa bjoerkii]
MGRRKIEIKAIKDDRNRSVTFLKRKGGLFKKAHELSVLCSVDVAVIIFGHNKKLYEFSSGNIQDTIGRHQYYGEPHEHKGPADFNGKGGDDDDDEDIDEAALEESLPLEHNIPPHLQDQPGFQHMRSVAPSASPPISNGVIPYPHRQHTPQPQMGSRPSSRNNNSRRQSSNLVPQHQQQVSHGPSVSNGFAYMPNPTVYNPHAAQGMPSGSHPGHQPGQHLQFQYSQQAPQHAQLQQTFLQDQRRQSMPPAFPQNERSQSQPQHQQQRHTPSPPQPRQEHQELQPYQPKPIPAKSRSIFTPIDDSRSLLAQQWGIGSTSSDSRSDTIKAEKDNRSQSVDMGSVNRNNSSVPPPPPAKTSRTVPQPQRVQSISAVAGDMSGAKRPRLKVQIPSEQSDEGSATAGSSPRGSGETAETPAKAGTEATHSSGVVLPPPSPSASALLSAGAQGPPNPFARPPIPMSTAVQNTQAYNSNNNIETPISALPSRFVADGLLPSPSSFYPGWDFGRSGGDNNMLPSPLNFQTPVVGNGPSFLRDEDGERKRKSPEGDGQQDSANMKRVKT